MTPSTLGEFRPGQLQEVIPLGHHKQSVTAAGHLVDRVVVLEGQFGALSPSRLFSNWVVAADGSPPRKEQGRSVEDLEALWTTSFWEKTFKQADVWDKQIEDFNDKTGVLKILAKSS